ncbi:nucleotide modification associated domain-containing protein [uncultured Enterococcus sp.]|uniref:nucleotide modification associated domain-containing protein n=1 Tax=uncultured Enterococcus sp. TaxID=167972 RepID=UPI002595695F|nr:nucleotide modification associated domain-containing protein [uncultured Enterococcus sp.]
MAQTYGAKNADYGNSFDKSLDEFGIVASLVRITDKLNRAKQLSRKEAHVDESMRDTLMDLANYAVMTVLWMQAETE